MSGMWYIKPRLHSLRYSNAFIVRKTCLQVNCDVRDNIPPVGNTSPFLSVLFFISWIRWLPYHNFKYVISFLYVSYMVFIFKLDMGRDISLSRCWRRHLNVTEESKSPFTSVWSLREDGNLLARDDLPPDIHGKFCIFYLVQLFHVYLTPKV